MKPTESEIELLLRAAPQPPPPAGLKERLLQEIPPPVRSLNARRPLGLAPPRTTTPAGEPRTWPDWLVNWWPALAAACLALACLAVLAAQHAELNELRRQVNELKRDLATPAQESSLPATAPFNATGLTVPHSRADLERLRGLKQQLAGEVTALEALQAENEKLRARALSQSGLAPEEVQPMLDARAKARGIACVNNLKQLGLAVRIWASSHGGLLPPDLLSLSNELVSPKILVCPEDTGRPAAADWGGFTPANVSYEFLAPSGDETEPTRVVFRCPLHGHVGLADGSVQQSVAKEQPERLVWQEGKLYLGPPPLAPLTPGAAPQIPQIQMDPRMRERYGLLPDASSTGSPPAQFPVIRPDILRRYDLLPTNHPGASQAEEPAPAP
jgi:hypothetical protein